jgi:hypothetical protein
MVPSEPNDLASIRDAFEQAVRDAVCSELRPAAFLARLQGELLHLLETAPLTGNGPVAEIGLRAALAAVRDDVLARLIAECEPAN